MKMDKRYHNQIIKHSPFLQNFSCFRAQITLMVNVMKDTEIQFLNCRRRSTIFKDKERGVRVWRGILLRKQIGQNVHSRIVHSNWQGRIIFIIVWRSSSYIFIWKTRINMIKRNFNALVRFGIILISLKPYLNIKLPISVVVTEGDWKQSWEVEGVFGEVCWMWCCWMCSIPIDCGCWILQPEFEHPDEVSQQLEDWTSLLVANSWHGTSWP